MSERHRRIANRFGRSAAPAIACASLACGTTDIPVLFASPGADAGADSSRSPSTPSPTLDAFCAGSGPPVLVDALADGGPASTCPDQLAQRAFRYALCTCQNYVSDHALVTDAFDGSRGAYAPGVSLAGGSVGVNGDLHPTGTLEIGGSLWASNATDITTAAVHVAGELHAQGEVRPSSLDVGGDAWLAGGLQTTGDVTVKGALHVPAGAPVDVGGARNFGAPVQSSFRIAPACDCDPSELVDVAGVVATYRTRNDDAALHIDPTMLENVQTDFMTPLPCGRIYLTHVSANQASITLTVAAGVRVVLVVDGYISTNDFAVDVAPGGELDLFVAGTIDVRGTFRVGSQSNPARARTYVGGSSVNLQSASTLAGNVYAPHAVLTLGGSAPTTLYGALFLSSLSAAADLSIHYDQAIMTPSSSPACPPPAACTSCNDCGGQACNSFTCGACADGSQCCAPLVCGPQGTCVGVVVP